MVPLDERFTQALHGGARAWRVALERHLKARGLTVAGWSAVAAVAGCARAPSQRELAGLLGVDGATLVATIDRLAAGGLVERQPDPHDRRVKLVTLTGKGRELAEQVQIEATALRRLTLQHFDAQHLAVAATLLEELQQLLETA